MSTVRQYLTLYCLFFVCHCAHRCLLESVQSLKVLHTVLSIYSLSLWTLLNSTACPLSICTSYCTVGLFRVRMSSFVLYSLSTVCQHLTLFRLFDLCHYVHCGLLESVQCLTLPQIVLPFLFCATTTAVFCHLPTVRHYLSQHLLLLLCYYVHYWF